MDTINQKIQDAENRRAEIIAKLLSHSPCTMVEGYIANLTNGTAAQYVLSDSTVIQLPLTEDEFVEKLLVCENLFFEIDALDAEDEPEITVTISFGVKDDITGGHGWEIDCTTFPL